MRIRVPEDPVQLTGVRLETEFLERNSNSVFPYKRVFDFFVAAIAILLLAPLIALFALLVKLQDGGKAFYGQTRYGRNGKTFRCYKIRSMSQDANDRLKLLLSTHPELKREWLATQKLKNDPRITPLGHFLRKTSIDELPQLWNVLCGDMSIVGPRPIVKEEIQKYGDNYRFYTSVRPGLTGLWQIEGRAETTYQERVEMDVEYAQTRSFFMDVLIMLKTIPAVLFSRGAY
jgi:Undecaprenyl-phosphate galactose phosphotransferase WbaP